MKILFIKNIPSPYRNHLFNLMQEIFPKYEIEFEVWYMAEIEPDRYWKLDLADFRYPHRFFKGFGANISNIYAHINPSLFCALITENYDIAIVGGIGAPSFWLAPFFIPGNGRKKLMWSESNLTSSLRKTGLFYQFKQWLISQYNGYIIPGDKAKKYLRYFSSDSAMKPFFSLPNLVDSQLYSRQVSILRQQKSKLKEKYKVANIDKPIWLISARLVESKGIIPFLEGMKGIDNVVVLVAGEGHLKNHLEDLITDLKLSVILLGGFQQNEMLELYAIADLFVLPSLSDPSPLSAIEAIAAELPLLISCRLGNAPEVLVEKTNGWSFDPEDSVESRQKLFSEIANQSLPKLQEMGRSSSVVYNVNFNSETIVNRLAVNLIQFWSDSSCSKL